MMAVAVIYVLPPIAVLLAFRHYIVASPSMSGEART